MTIVHPKADLLLSREEALDMLRKIERCGRICYKSEDKITPTSYEDFIRGIIKRGHLSVIEHGSFTAIFVCDRGVTHELVRHRLASYSQESTRYVKYNDIEVVAPEAILVSSQRDALEAFGQAMSDSQDAYLKLIGLGFKPEIARAVLPTGLKTEIAVTANLREWRHIFEMRCSQYAHPQIRQIMISLLKQVQAIIPVVFQDFRIDEDRGIAFTINSERTD